MREDQGVSDDGVLTAPLQVAGEGPAAKGPAKEPEKAAVERAAVTEADPAPVRAFGQDVDRLADLVERLSSAAAVLGERLDGEVRGVLGEADKALADARAARQEAADAHERTRQAEARADLALQEAADAREELEKGLATAKASVTAAQESEANAWKEAGAHQQARATSGNEAANAEGLRKRAEAAWSTEHQARVEAEQERDDLSTRLAAEQSALAGEQAALATVRTELADTRTELAQVRARLEAAIDTERQLRAELSAAHGEIAGLTVERDSVTERAAELATRTDRAEQRAEAADARIDTERERADVAVRRADDAEERINRDAATVRALQDTLRSALDLPSVEDLDEDRGVPVGESGTVKAGSGGAIVVEGLPDVLDGELAARFARALLAVRVHQATRRAVQDEGSGDSGGEADGAGVI